MVLTSHDLIEVEWASYRTEDIATQLGHAI